MDQRLVCKNPWCKVTFICKSDTISQTCPKCESFDKDLSGGVTWTDKKYEGDRFDGRAHQISINVKRYLK